MPDSHAAGIGGSELGGRGDGGEHAKSDDDDKSE
jgi:hypothetical protein